MSLEELKTATLTGVTSTKQDRYISMPLEGRVDLLMPKNDPIGSPDGSHGDGEGHPEDATVLVGEKLDVGDHSSSSPSQSSAGASEQGGQGNDQRSSEGSAWDAAHHPPPKNSRPEMVIPMTTVYAPAWDEPPSASATYFEEMVESAFDYPTLPKIVTSNDWYGDITSSKPDPRMVSNVFPWEHDSQSRPTVTRRFPKPSPTPGEPKDALPSGETHDHATTAPLRPERTQVTSSGASGSDGTRSFAPDAGVVSKGRPTLNFAESMASYTNAWDEVASIHTYAQRLTALGIGVERRAQASGLDTAVATPRGTATPTLAYHQPSPVRSPSSSSADGDDEDERDDGDRANINRRRSPTYRDRETQTERLGVDAMVQTLAESSGELVSERATGMDFPVRASRPSHARQQSSRTWDPSTDIDLRRQDSEELLHRFMKANVG